MEEERTTSVRTEHVVRLAAGLLAGGKSPSAAEAVAQSAECLARLQSSAQFIELDGCKIIGLSEDWIQVILPPEAS